MSILVVWFLITTLIDTLKKDTSVQHTRTDTFMATNASEAASHHLLSFLIPPTPENGDPNPSDFSHCGSGFSSLLRLASYRQRVAARFVSTLAWWRLIAAIFFTIFSVMSGCPLSTASFFADQRWGMSFVVGPRVSKGFVLLASAQTINNPPPPSQIRVISYDHNRYVSEYFSACKVKGLRTYADAVRHCESLGLGWGLASIPNAEVNTAVGEMCSDEDVMYIGLKRKADFGTSPFAWTHGRLQGEVVASGGMGNCHVGKYSIFQIDFYCSWQAGEPSYSIPGELHAATRLTAAGQYQWYDIGQRYADSGVVCERSPCSLVADCVAANTQSVVGSYFPNCQCKCIASARGTRCEIFTVQHTAALLPELSYTSEYAVFSSPNVTFSQAAAFCSSINAAYYGGSRWRIATTPSFDGALAIARAAWPHTAVLGMEATGSSNSSFRFTDGRLNGRLYQALSATSCFLDGKPMRSKCPLTSELSATNTNHRVAVQASFFDDAGFQTYAKVHNELFVAVCERAPCDAGFHCEAGQKLSSSTQYYTSAIGCTCVCDAAETWGNECDFPLTVSQGPYTSQYAFGCTTTGLSWNEGNAACASSLITHAPHNWKTPSFPDRSVWQLASVPTQTAFERLRLRIDVYDENADRQWWLGGALISNSQWQWRFGRLKGLTFHYGRKGGTTQTYRYADTDFRFTAWETATEPNGDGNENFLGYIAGSRQKWFDVAQTADTTNAVYRCYLCERTFCEIAIDCNVNNSISVSGFFPKCTCQCHAGHWGPQCDFPITVAHKGFLIAQPSTAVPYYTSEYGIVCAAAPQSFNQLGSLCGSGTATHAGNGPWRLATFPSAESADALKQHIRKYFDSSAAEALGFATGGIRHDGQRFKWSTGRLQDEFYYHQSQGTLMYYNRTNKAFRYTNWMTSEPAAGVYVMVLSVRPSRDVNNLYFQWIAQGSDFSTALAGVKCGVCERMACVLELDCVAANTISVTGNVPSCQCNCAANAMGSRCEILIVEHTPTAYTSHYVVMCGTLLSWNDAFDRCATRSPAGEWWLATVPSAAANGNISSLLIDKASLGGRAVSFTNQTYVWQGGRLKGMAFSDENIGRELIVSYFDYETRLKFVNWDINEPNSGDTEDALQLLLGEKWNNIDRPAKTNCYVCERSPCMVGLDCYAKHATAAEGFFPDCRCSCREGSWGTRCEYPIVVNHSMPSSVNPAYMSEYDIVCNNGTWAAAKDFCSGKGWEWGLASVPTLTAHRAIAARLAPKADTSRFLLGGTDEGTEGSWKWVAGRLEGMIFFALNAAVEYSAFQFKFAMWAGGGSDNANGAGYTAENYLMLKEGEWTDYSGLDSSTFERCAVCERSPCSAPVDCDLPGTLRGVGYWPKCVCMCKPGYWGARCGNQSIIVDHGNYVSHYDVVCDWTVPHSPHGNWSWHAEKTCASHGAEWFLATVPMAVTQNELIAALTKTPLANGQMFAFGGSDDVTEGRWLWLYGRLKGSVFLDGSRFENFKNPPSSATAIPESQRVILGGFGLQWQTGLPNGSVPGGDYLNLQSTSGGALRWTQANKADTFDSCAVCERSPCHIQSDCVAANTGTVSGGYYGHRVAPNGGTVPNCICNCKPGYWGLQCSYSFPLIVNHTRTATAFPLRYDYVSEYTVYGAARQSSVSASSEQLCQSLGQGYHPATIPSAEANTNLTRLLTAFTARDSEVEAVFFTAGADTQQNGTWVWTHGRLNGKVFSAPLRGSSRGAVITTRYSYGDVDFQYADWAEGEHFEKDRLLFYPRRGASGRWNGNTVTGDSSATVDSWYVLCERTRCSLPLDCVEENTRSSAVELQQEAAAKGGVPMDGYNGSYWPHCTCVCKAGFKGERCEKVKDPGERTESTLISPTASVPLSPSASPPSVTLSRGTLSLTRSATDSLSRQTSKGTVTVSKTAELASTDSVTVTISFPTQSLRLSPTQTRGRTDSFTISDHTSSRATNSISVRTASRTVVMIKPIPAESPLTQGAGAVIIVGSALSPVGGAVSAGMALIRAAKCGTDDDETPRAAAISKGGSDSSEGTSTNAGESSAVDGEGERELPVLVHPLRFKLTSTRMGQQQAAVLGNGIVIPALVLFIVGGPIAGLTKLVSRQPTWVQTYELIGFPSVVVLPFSVLTEGLGVCVVELLYVANESFVNAFLGIVGLVIFLFLAAVWEWALFVRLPFGHLEAELTTMLSFSRVYADSKRQNRRGVRRTSSDDVGGDNDPQTDGEVPLSHPDVSLTLSSICSIRFVSYALSWSAHARREWVFNGMPQHLSFVTHLGDEADDVAIQLELGHSNGRHIDEMHDDDAIELMPQNASADDDTSQFARPASHLISRRASSSDASRLAIDRSGAGGGRRRSTLTSLLDDPLLLDEGLGDGGVSVDRQWDRRRRTSDVNGSTSASTTPQEEGGSKDSSLRKRLSSQTAQRPLILTKIFGDRRFDKITVDRDILRFTNLISEKTFIWADFLCFVLSFALGVAEGIQIAGGDKVGCQVRAVFMVLFAIVQGILGIFAFIPLEWVFNFVQLLMILAISIITLIAVAASSPSEGGSSGDGSLSPFILSSLDALGDGVNILGMIGIIIGVVRTFSQIRVAGKRQRRIQRKIAASLRKSDAFIGTAASNSPPLSPPILSSALESSVVSSLSSVEGLVGEKEGDNSPQPFATQSQADPCVETSSAKEEETLSSTVECKAIRFSDPYAALRHAVSAQSPRRGKGRDGKGTDCDLSEEESPPLVDGLPHGNARLLSREEVAGLFDLVQHTSAVYDSLGREEREPPLPPLPPRGGRHYDFLDAHERDIVKEVVMQMRFQPLDLDADGGEATWSGKL